MFSQLLNYISGENVRNVKMEMTNPILNYYNSNDNNDLIKKCFFIPKSFHLNTPHPIGTVFISSESELKLAVVTFYGKATLDDFIAYRSKLIKVLNENQVTGPVIMTGPHFGY